MRGPRQWVVALWMGIVVVSMASAAGCTLGSQAAVPEATPPSLDSDSGAIQAGPISPRPFDPGAVELALEPVVTGLQEPTYVGSAKDGSGRLFVLERAGRILIVRDGRLLPNPFLDIQPMVSARGSEQGLLGLAFHPQFTENGWLYINFTNTNGDTTIVRYAVSRDPDVVDPNSALPVLQIPQPAANHNGGNLVFGPDGYLYIGMGDGGGAGDQYGNAQNLSSLLGKLLRIDVNASVPYAIPPDNPFVTRDGARTEIWAYGLRNPWRFSFDRATDDLYIADVGQNRFEWVHLEGAGAGGGRNYGWPIVEGSQCYPGGQACDRSALPVPITEYSHDLGCSITGGFVYRGRAYPSTRGVYFFADYCSGRVWALDRQADRTWRQTELIESSLSISSFGEDQDGELFVTSLRPGGLYRLVIRART
ncbi:MAG: glucose dehydrogenase [Chloroflexi bacterium]|nr:glucose dehydrogenase [Chloroflexota bacterium]